MVPQHLGCQPVLTTSKSPLTQVHHQAHVYKSCHGGTTHLVTHPCRSLHLHLLCPRLIAGGNIPEQGSPTHDCMSLQAVTRMGVAHSGGQRSQDRAPPLALDWGTTDACTHTQPCAGHWPGRTLPLMWRDEAWPTIHKALCLAPLCDQQSFTGR